MFLNVMMLNKIFMFQYQLNQNTSCNMKLVINMNRQSKGLTNRHVSEQPFHLPRVYPADDAHLTFGELPRVLPGVRDC